MPRPRSEFRKGWPALTAATAGMATGTTGLPFFTFGLFIAPLSQAFGWTNAEISGSMMAKTVATVLTFGIVGRLADRMGVRPVAIASLALTAAGFACFQLLTPSIWSFYIAWFFLSALGAGTSPAIWTRCVSTWFDRSRGLAIGLTLVGSGISSALAPIAVEAAIETGGWRMGYALLSAVPVVVGLPLVIAFFRESPAPVASDERPGETAGPRVVGMAIREAVRTRQFWQIGIGMFLGGGAISGLIIQLIPLLDDQGISRASAIALASIMGLAVTGGRLAMGLLLDEFAGNIVGLWCFVLCGLAALGLTLGMPVWVVMACVLVIGLCAGAEVDLMSYLTSRYFGLASFSEICSWLLVIFTIGSGLFPPMMGYLRDVSGDYTGSLVACAGALAASAVLFGTLGRYRY